jgi:hypothetical protein
MRAQASLSLLQYRAQYTYLKRHTEKFCAKTVIQSRLSNTKYNRYSLEKWLATFFQFGHVGHFVRSGHFGQTGLYI